MRFFVYNQMREQATGEKAESWWILVSNGWKGERQNKVQLIFLFFAWASVGLGLLEKQRAETLGKFPLPVLELRIKGNSWLKT